MIVSFPLFYIAIIVIPLVLVGINNHLLKQKYNDLTISLFSACIMYLFILISVSIYDNYLVNKLNAFDLNGDEVFSGEEITPEQDAAMDAVIWDTGRTFAPITGAIFSLGYFAVVYLFLRILDAIRSFFVTSR